MNINLFTAAIKDITERNKAMSTGAAFELVFNLRSGDALTGTIETFDMNGLIVVKDAFGGLVYVAADDVVTVRRSM